MPAAHGACLRSARACVPDTCSAQPTTRRHGSVTQLPSGRSGCAGRIVKSGGLIRDIHAALSQLPVSPIIHIMSSNRDLGLPTGAGWILIGNRCGPACARSTGPHTRSGGPRADPGLPRAQLRGRDVNLRAAAHPPRRRCRSPAAPTPDGHRRSWPDIAHPSRRRRPDACALRRHPVRTRPRTSTTSRTQSAQRTRIGRCTVSREPSTLPRRFRRTPPPPSWIMTNIHVREKLLRSPTFCAGSPRATRISTVPLGCVAVTTPHPLPARTRTGPGGRRRSRSRQCTSEAES